MIFAPDKQAISRERPPVLNSNTGISETAYTSRSAVSRVLEEVREKRYELTIKLQRGERLYVYQTRIQHVDLVTGQIVLHRLVPSDWQEAVGIMAEVEVQAQMASGLIRFEAFLAPLEPNADTPYCVLSLPLFIQRQQLRSSYRVPVPARFSTVTLPHERDVIINGFCLNLSLEGSCCVFRAHHPERFRDGALLQGLNFVLDGTMTFRTDATICRVDVLHGARTQVGMRFHELDKDVQRKLQASLINFQRQNLRQPFERD